MPRPDRLVTDWTALISTSVLQSADGQRFLVSRLTVEPSASPIRLVLND
jgi:hypothetical protein